VKRIEDLDISDPMTTSHVLEEATFLINNRADKESLEPVAEKLRELSSYYEARASDNRPQPCSQTKKLMIFYEACRFLEVDRDFKIDCNFNTGLITFNDNFFVAPRTHKWRFKGMRSWVRYGLSDQEKVIKQYLLGEEYWNEKKARA
tara:strand:- start:227 stop:667 length:441 start_codon:yes stop_codon:yes gene_type:complete